MKKVFALLLFSLCLCSYNVGFSATPDAYEPPPVHSRLDVVDKDKVENVILFIGDGMSVANVSIARYRGAGPTGILHMDRMPVAGFVRTCSADKLITDSAASSTALASGFKTNNGVIGRTPDQRNVVSILEAVQEKGMKTGLVATSSLTHATPAGFGAHAEIRREEAAIAENYIKNKIDVLLGGGLSFFLPDKGKRTDGRNLLEEARQAGYDVVLNAEQLQTTQASMLLGLFSDEAMKTTRPEPSLAEMTAKSIAALNQRSKGFFLMVEGSQIDWENHDNDLEGAVKQTLDFDMAIKEALDFAVKDGKTLVLVTADHETGGPALLGGKPDGSELQVAWTTKGHTGSTVPLYAYGPGACDFSGFHDNTDLPKIMARLLRIKNFPRLAL